MSPRYRKLLAVTAAVLVVGLLNSCSIALPTYIKLEENGFLSFAACYPSEHVTSIELKFERPVDGDPRAFEQNVVTFSGPAFDLDERESITLPAIAAGWTSDPDYASFADWTTARIVLTTGGGGTSSDTFGKANLKPGQWTQLGADAEGCSAPL